MDAIMYKKFGPPEVLELTETTLQKPDDDQVLVKMKATSVNPIDWKLRKGILKPITRFRLPIIPGGDISGIIEEIGFGVRNLQKGHEVFGLTPAVRGGAYAEYALVNKRHLWFKPENLSFEEAAAIPLAGLTAYQGLYDKGGIHKRIRVFINGCTGGVGSFAVQVAKAFECEVTGVCSDAKTEFAGKLGVDKIMDYNSNFVLGGDTKYDIFFDVHGNLSYNQVKHLLYSDGIYINTLPSLNLYFNALVRRNKVKRLWANSNRRDLSNLKEMVEKNLVKPFIDRVYPLQETVKAHKYCESGGIAGKVVIKIS